MAWESPPPRCESDRRDDTSQQVPLFGELGHTVMYPFLSEPCRQGIKLFWKYDCAVDWHEWMTTTRGGLATTLSGLYTHLFLDCCVSHTILYATQRVLCGWVGLVIRDSRLSHPLTETNRGKDRTKGNKSPISHLRLGRGVVSVIRDLCQRGR